MIAVLNMEKCQSRSVGGGGVVGAKCNSFLVDGKRVDAIINKANSTRPAPDAPAKTRLSRTRSNLRRRWQDLSKLLPSLCKN